jgi:hypothetical protein
LLAVLLHQPLMLGLFLLGFRREIVRSEGHRLDASWHASVACCHSDVLKEVLKFLGERDPCETSCGKKSSIIV